MHQRGCLISCKYCESCKEAIDISEFEEHSKNHLTKIQDTLINKEKFIEYNKPKIDTNLKKLESLLLNCKFCDLQLPESQYDDHEAMCGARTTSCEYCNKKLLIKQLIAVPLILWLEDQLQGQKILMKLQNYFNNKLYLQSAIIIKFDYKIC